MKILVLGSNGMLGHVIALHLMKRENVVTGIARQYNPFISTIICDVKDKERLKEIIISQNFDYIINCIALLVKESEDNKADSIYINSYLPHYIAGIIRPLKTKLIQISTDSVFSGRGENVYFEKNKKDCERFYDLTKSLGEIDDTNNITIRTSVIGFESKKNGTNLINWFLKQKGKVYGYDNVIWCGVTSVEYAKMIEKLMKMDCQGIFHLSNSSGISKGDLLRLINKYLRKNEIKILSNNDIKMKRILINTNNTLGLNVSSYEKMICDLRKWILDKELYYKYFYGKDLYDLIQF